MKVIEIGNCLPCNSPGIIISASKAEIEKFAYNLIYRDVKIISSLRGKLEQVSNQMDGARMFLEFLREKNQTSYTQGDLDIICKEFVEEYGGVFCSIEEAEKEREVKE